MSRSRLIVGTLVAGAMFLAATPALAVPPEVFSFVDDNFDDPDVIVDACGPGADIVLANEVRVTERTHFDQQGNPVRVQIHFMLDGTVTRTDTGNSARDSARLYFEADLVNDVLTASGYDWNLVYPGVGPFFQSIGRAVFEGGTQVFSAGPGDYDEGLDPFDEACKVLG